MASARSYATGSFFLVLDGTPCGFVRSVEGGGAVADVVVEPSSTYWAAKHLGAVRWEPLRLGLDLALDRSVYDWIGATLAGASARHDVTLVAVDAALKPVSEREFFNAQLVEVAFPALDAAAKAPAHLAIAVVPEYARGQKSTGAALKVPAAKAKQWLPSNFRLGIDGLDCSRVTKVDAFTVRRMPSEDTVGETRDYAQPAPRLDFPSLRVTLPAAHAQTWADWHADFVVKGLNDASREKTGSLELLASNLKGVLARVDLHGLGIFRLAPLAATGSESAVPLLAADLYCERLELTVP